VGGFTSAKRLLKHFVHNLNSKIYTLTPAPATQEMKMIDVRVPLKEHKLKLAKECIKGLTPRAIREEVPDKAV